MSTTSATQTRREPLHLRNELDKSRSPYVRAHMDNPVAWQEWKPETLALAKKHDRLLFVSIGYAACHWCHVMEHESFEDDQIADVLNDHFIPIKIDREERPDIDRIYMQYVQATSGRGGWPMSVFLTPDLEPVFGGTYFPGPNTEMAKQGATNFLDLAKRIQMMWETQRERMIYSAKDVTRQLREFASSSNDRTGLGSEDSSLELELLDVAYQHFEQRYDPEFGGFGSAPKFPTPPNLSFLLSLGAFPTEVKDVVGHQECETAKQMVLTTLRYMTRGGINDQIGNGFCRYSVTADWSLPHFEKMLYDQPQLLSLYLDAFLLTGDAEMLGTVYSISSYLTSPPIHSPTGGFCSSEDADSFPHPSSTNKREGGFYVWTKQEFNDILGSKDADICAAFWNVQEHGNVDSEHDAHNELEEQNVLQIASTPEKLSEKFGMPKVEVVKILKKAKAKLLEYRDQNRPRPDLDDKIVAGWNGLAIGALSRVSSVFHGVDSDKAKECKEAAIKAVDFLRRELLNEQTGEMKRVYREGAGDAPAFAEDYAFVVQGLIELYEATFDDQYLELADKLQKTQIRIFHDTKNGGFFSTSQSQTDLLLPTLKDASDAAEPSTNGITALNLYRLSSFLQDEEYKKLAENVLAAFEAEITEHPFIHASLLGAVVWQQLGGREVTVVGEGEDLDAAVAILRSRLKASTTVTRLGKDAKSDWLVKRNELLSHMDVNKKMIQICEKGECKIVDDVKRLAAEIDGRNLSLSGV